VGANTGRILAADLNGDAKLDLITVQGTVSATGVNPVTATSYNPASQVTGLTFGSTSGTGDSDSYQYDTNTGRVKQYSFNVNGKSAVGNLTWYSNGTLQQLAITDAVNSQDNQTCNNTFDALARISSVSCNSGTAWGQTFA
jgi:hypothetical protein